MTLKTDAKRFYKEVSVREDGRGFAVLLDGRTIKTPAGSVLLAPSRALGEAVADEWRAQGETLKLETMQLTKALNTALDRVAANRTAIVDELVKYAGSDLLCYWAEGPEELVRRQSEVWHPLLDWVGEQYGAWLSITTGVVHVEQPADAMERIRAAVASHDNYRLVGLYTGVTITGSAVLGLALSDGASADEVLAAAEIDATYQAERWGRDAEAEKARANRLAELKAAEAYLKLLG
jgi:chaperone required for assembly of F1-ATPase